MNWLNRIATLLGLICFLMLAIGITIEVVTANLLFENYLSTFTAYGIILALLASLSRRSRR